MQIAFFCCFTDAVTCFSTCKVCNRSNVLLLLWRMEHKLGTQTNVLMLKITFFFFSDTSRWRVVETCVPSQEPHKILQWFIQTVSPLLLAEGMFLIICEQTALQNEKTVFIQRIYISHFRHLICLKFDITSTSIPFYRDRRTTLRIGCCRAGGNPTTLSRPNWSWPLLWRKNKKWLYLLDCCKLVGKKAEWGGEEKSIWLNIYEPKVRWRE